MKKQLALLGLLAAALGPGPATAQELQPAPTAVVPPVAAPPVAAPARPWSDDAVFRDPEWRKSFLGSYGFLSGAEPNISATELELLREVIEVMRADPRAAVAMLQPQTGASSSAALDFILANLEFQNGNLDSALKHYQSAIEKFPDFRRAQKNLGLLMVQKNDCQQALGHLSRAVELGDRDGRNYGLMGFCYIERENYIAAEEAYRNAILQEPDTRDWKLGLARSLLGVEHYRDAAALFDALIEENPDDVTLWMLQANAFVGLERPLDAAVNLEAVRLMGKAQTSSLVLLGDIYMNAQMYDLAKGAYLEVIHGDEGAAQFPTAYRAADLLVRTRSYAQAEEILASIGKRYGKLPEDDQLEVLTLQAKAARGLGREAKAAELLESIVKRDGTRGDALLELAAHHRDRGNVERARFLIERAENLESFEYQALLAHAQIEVSERDYGRAAELLRRALQIKHEPRVELFLSRIEQAHRS